jgi:hypothetical protein
MIHRYIFFLFFWTPEDEAWDGWAGGMERDERENGDDLGLGTVNAWCFLFLSYFGYSSVLIWFFFDIPSLFPSCFIEPAIYFCSKTYILQWCLLLPSTPFNNLIFCVLYLFTCMASISGFEDGFVGVEISISFNSGRLRTFALIEVPAYQPYFALLM